MFWTPHTKRHWVWSRQGSKKYFWIFTDTLVNSFASYYHLNVLKLWCTLNLNMKRCWFSIQNIWPDWLVFGSRSFLGVSVTCVTCINLISDFDGGFDRLIWNTFLYFYTTYWFCLGEGIYTSLFIHSFIHSFIILFCLWEVFLLG